MTYPGIPGGYARTLVENHSLRIRIDVLDLAMKSTGQQLTTRIIDGQVNGDASAEVTRSASLTLLDPEHQLHFDSDSPADGALYNDRMLRIWFGVKAVGATASWVEVPIITGVVTKFTRDGASVPLELQSKECLAKGAAWRTKTYKKGTRKRDVIEDVMRKEGERHFSFGEVNERLPADITLTVDTVPWDFCKRLAASMGAQLFYDGYGRLRLRDRPRRSVWTFATGDGGSVMTQPKVTFDIAAVKNAVRVVGKKPKGARTKVRAVAVAPANHPLSPRRLGRNGEGRYLAEFIDDSSIGSTAAARRLARRRLGELMLQLVTVEFDALVIPHLDVGDVVTVQTGDFRMNTPLDRFSIPLTASGTMSCGYNRRIPRPRAIPGRRKGRR